MTEQPQGRSFDSVIADILDESKDTRLIDAEIAALVEPFRFDAPGFSRIRPVPDFSMTSERDAIRFKDGGILALSWIPRYTASVDEAIALVERVLPGWAWSTGACYLSTDAWIAPDFNSPKHGKTLRRDLFGDEDAEPEAGSVWDVGFGADLRPPCSPAIALCFVMLHAKKEIAGVEMSRLETPRTDGQHLVSDHG